MYQGEAKYHTGKNATTHDVQLAFDIETGELTFEFEGETIKWAPYSYRFEKRGKTLLLFNAKDYSNFEIIDPDFAVPFLQRFDSISQASFYTKLIRAGFAAHIGLALMTLGVVYFLSQHAIPYVTEKSVYLIPPSFDDKLGETYFDEFLMYANIDDEKTLMVQAFANSMDLDSKKEIKITIVDEPVVNAFALPSGHVVIYTGILDEMERYEELAALISHEVSHVNKRHSMRALLREVSGRLFLSAIVGDVSKFTDILVSNAGKLTGLSYSRELETEADVEGLKLMKKNKINTIGFQLLFKRLSEASGGINPPEFLSTHPVTDHRISTAKKNTAVGKPHPGLKKLFKDLTAEKEEKGLFDENVIHDDEDLEEFYEELEEVLGDN